MMRPTHDVPLVARAVRAGVAALIAAWCASCAPAAPYALFRGQAPDALGIDAFDLAAPVPAGPLALP